MQKPLLQVLTLHTEFREQCILFRVNHTNTFLVCVLLYETFELFHCVKHRYVFQSVRVMRLASQFCALTTDSAT